MVFDASKPCARAIRCPSFGGGWIIALNDEGRLVLEEYFGTAATPIAPLGGQEGWIVEPADSEDLANYLINEKIAWEVQ